MPRLRTHTHNTLGRTFVDYLRADGWSVAAVFCLDCHFVSDAAKYIAGAMQACG